MYNKINIKLLPVMDVDEIRGHLKCSCGCRLDIVDFELMQEIEVLAAEFLLRDGDYQMEVLQAIACYRVGCHENFKRGRRIKFRIIENSVVMDPIKLIERLRELKIPVACKDDYFIIDTDKKRS